MTQTNTDFITRLYNLADANAGLILDRAQGVYGYTIDDIYSIRNPRDLSNILPATATSIIDTINDVQNMSNVADYVDVVAGVLQSYLDDMMRD